MISSFQILLIIIGPLLFSLQEDPPSSDPPSDPPNGEAGSSTLDDLLGIEEEGSPDPGSEGETDTDPVTEAERKKLDDLLNERSLAENLDAAISDMQVAARMIGRSRSTGIDVQRVQEEIMSRLDAAIEEAMRQQQQQQQQSSSSQQQQQQQEQQSEPGEVPQQPDQSDQQPSGDAGQQQTTGENTDQLPQDRREAELEMMFKESDVEWGNLPERMRSILRQGLRESVSRMYQELTESYYRRIAEDASE